MMRNGQWLLLRHREIDLKGIDFDVLLLPTLLNPSEHVMIFRKLQRYNAITMCQTDEVILWKRGETKDSR